MDSSQVKPTGQHATEKMGPRYVPVAEPGDSEDTELLKLLQSSQRLCVTEDAGAGKTIFTRRLVAFLSGQTARQILFGGLPCLAVRFERRSELPWPDDFQAGLVQALASQVERACQNVGGGVSATEVAEWAIEHGRVVLIFDALDQIQDPARLEALQGFLNGQLKRPEEERCRIVLTSRAYAANREKHGLFHSEGWQWAKIEGFEIEQQQEYLKGIVPDIVSLSENESPRMEEARRREEPYRRAFQASGLFPNYNEIADLLRVPVVLAMIRRLAERKELKPFQTRAELYLQVHNHLTERAAKKLGIEADSTRRRRWREILAAVAFQMMLKGHYDYVVEGDDPVVDLKEAAQVRCREPRGNHTWEEEWKEIERVTDFTDRCLLEGVSKELMSFKHRGMMEFYAGVHLAANHQDNWVLSPGKETELIRCGDCDASGFINDENWYWAWRFAIEMPREVWASRPETLTASLAELFQRPQAGLRPTELLYRAWPLFGAQPGEASSQLLPGAAAILHAFRQEFQDYLAQGHPAAIALRDGFVRCPPQKVEDAERKARGLKSANVSLDCHTFWMGSAEDANGYYGESPRHHVRLDPFELHSTPITRAHIGCLIRGWENPKCRSIHVTQMK